MLSYKEVSNLSYSLFMHKKVQFPSKFQKFPANTKISHQRELQIPHLFPPQLLGIVALVELSIRIFQCSFVAVRNVASHDNVFQWFPAVRENRV